MFCHMIRRRKRLEPRSDPSDPPVRRIENPDDHIRFSVTQPIITLALSHSPEQFDLSQVHVVAGDVLNCKRE